MRIIGLCRIRNESEIIQETLDHWAKICSGGIYIYDDASTDHTVAICRAHPAIKDVVEGKSWDWDREKAEYENRQAVLKRAQEDARHDDWFVYFDADERIYFDDWRLLFDEKVKAIACRLYDVYITEEDVDKHYLARNYVGPEYRTIVMFFRNCYELGYDKPDQRIVNLPPDVGNIPVSGLIKHFGKGISVKHWEDTCRYYIENFPKYAEKWKKRRGKAIHYDMKSDFNNPLIQFTDVLSGREEGIPLESQTYGKS